MRGLQKLRTVNKGVKEEVGGCKNPPKLADDNLSFCIGKQGVYY